MKKVKGSHKRRVLKEFDTIQGWEWGELVYNFITLRTELKYHGCEVPFMVGMVVKIHTNIDTLMMFTNEYIELEKLTSDMTTRGVRNVVQTEDETTSRFNFDLDEMSGNECDRLTRILIDYQHSIKHGVSTMQKKMSEIEKVKCLYNGV